MYLRGLVMGIIYRAGLHLAETHRVLFLSPTVFTQVLFYREQSNIMVALLCGLRITWKCFGKKAKAHLSLMYAVFPTCPLK